MDLVRISVKENEANWRERCYARVEILKAQVYSPTSSDVCQEKYLTVLEMQKAVKNGDVDNFVDTMEKVCSDYKLPLSDIFDVVTPSGDSLLHKAAYFGMTNIAELIGYQFPGLLTKTNMKGDTPLHVAARAMSSDVIKVILSQYRALSQESASSSENEDERITRFKNEFGNTTLHEAVCGKHLDGVNLLFEADKSVAHYLNKPSQSPLYLAVLTGNKELVNVLLEAPFPDNKPLQNCHGISPLHAAIWAKNAGLIKEIVARKPELMYLRDEDEGTPLHYAASTGYVKGVCMLLKESAALEWNAKGHLPIHLACKRGHLKVVKEFLKQEWAHDSSVFVTRKAQNILHIAAKNGRYKIIKYLLRDAKFDVNQKDKDGNTPLHLASKNVFPNILLSLTRDKRIDLNLVNNEGFTARDTLWLQKAPATRKCLSDLVFRSVCARMSSKAERIIYNRTLPPTPAMVASARNQINTTMLVAILISTVTFAAGFTVPGGVYSSDDPIPHNRGMAVLVNRRMFKIFVIFNTVAMYSSTFACFLLGWAHALDYHLAARCFVIALNMVVMALVTMSLAFMAAVRLVVSSVSWLSNLITIIGIILLPCLSTPILFELLANVYVLLPLTRSVIGLHLRLAISLYGSPAKYKKSLASQQEDVPKEQQ